MSNATEVFQPLQADDPPVVAGYRLAARLGAGGMGRVYLSHTQGGRPVAIKVVRPELADDPAFRRRFRREVEAARRVRGAYTAELIDADADGVPPWLARCTCPGPP
ncbi:serine/threonine protein kinase [Streptomyces sp. V4I8]